MPADIVQGHVAESVHLVEFPLVHGIVPVHLEKALHHRGDLVHVVDVEGDDPHPEDVGDIGEGIVFRPFQFQFSREGLLLLDPALNGSDDDAGFIEEGADLRRDGLLHLREDRALPPIFLQDGLGVGVEFVLVCHIRMFLCLR